MGLTTGGAIGAGDGADARRLRARRSTPSADAARPVRDDVIVLCHGGPIATPDDAACILGRARACHGFYGASSMERLPTENALTETTRRFVDMER